MKEEVQFTIDHNKGLFFIKIGGEIEAEMTFELTNDDEMTINHTEVNEAHGGKGFGKDLLEKAVAYARANNLTIIPLCSFAKGVLEKTPTFKDVL